MAKRKTKVGPTPVAPPIIGRIQQSGMMRMGDTPLPPANIIMPHVRKPTGRKVPTPATSSVTPTKSTGMVRMGDMLSQSPENIAAMMKMPTTTRRKPVVKGRRK